MCWFEKHIYSSAINKDRDVRVSLLYGNQAQRGILEWSECQEKRWSNAILWHVMFNFRCLCLLRCSMGILTAPPRCRTCCVPPSWPATFACCPWAGTPVLLWGWSSWCAWASAPNVCWAPWPASPNCLPFPLPTPYHLQKGGHWSSSTVKIQYKEIHLLSFHV